MGLWIMLAIIVAFVVVALVIGRREQRPSQIDWTREAGGPPVKPTTSPAGPSSSLGGTGARGVGGGSGMTD